VRPGRAIEQAGKRAPLLREHERRPGGQEPLQQKGEHPEAQLVRRPAGARDEVVGARVMPDPLALGRHQNAGDRVLAQAGEKANHRAQKVANVGAAKQTREGK
jgi:hypothetical protein